MGWPEPKGRPAGRVGWGSSGSATGWTSCGFGAGSALEVDVVAGGECGVVEDSGVVLGGADGDAEQVADLSDVAAGEHFVDDAVSTDGLCGLSEGAVDPVAADGFGAERGAGVDEEVGVDGVRPASGTVVEVAGDEGLDGCGEGHGSVAEAEAAVADVDE